MKDYARLLLRTVVGGSLAGHGAQKLFGAFGGGGPMGTGAAFEEHLALSPGHRMAVLAGAGEFGGGIATALGLGGPLAPTAMVSTMAVAAATGHRGKPYFGQSGGPEMAILYGAVGTYFALDGFGDVSVDRLLGLKVPRSLALAFAVGSAVATSTIAMRARKAQDNNASVVAPQGQQNEQPQQRQDDAPAPALRRGA